MLNCLIKYSGLNFLINSSKFLKIFLPLPPLTHIPLYGMVLEFFPILDTQPVSNVMQKVNAPPTTTAF